MAANVDWSSASSQRLHSFRRQYRLAAIPPGYSAGRNWTANLSVCVALSAIAALLAGRWSAAAWGSFLAGLVTFNFFEYAFHRWISHKKRRLMGASYRRHAGEHHGFFERSAMTSDEALDFHVTIMPTATIGYYFALFCVALAAPLGLWVGRGPGAAFAAAIAVSLLQLDVLHCYYHLDASRPLARVLDRCAYLRYLKSRHTLHHDRELMSALAFNITHPLFDWLLHTGIPGDAIRHKTALTQNSIDTKQH